MWTRGVVSYRHRKAAYQFLDYPQTEKSPRFHVFQCQMSKNKAVPRNRASQMRRGEKEEKKTERRGRARGDAGEEACCVHAAAQRTRVDCIRFCCRFGTSHVRYRYKHTSWRKI